jgi:hypothetical protein
MGSRSIMFAVAAATVIFTGFAGVSSAAERGATVATLAKAWDQPVKVQIDGRPWVCEGTSCKASPSDYAELRAPTVECTHAAKKLGAFTAYETGKDKLDDKELATCNNSALAR